MSVKLGLIAAAVAMAFTSTAATAASYSSATLGPISVTLIDLNPMDGILPSISFNNNSGYANYVYASANDNIYYFGQAASSFGSSIGSDNTQSLASSQSGATATISSGNDELSLADTSLSATGYANGSNVSGSYSYYSAEAYVPYYYYYNTAFTLSANTGVIFTADAVVSATTTIGYQEGWGNESAFAYASLGVSGSSPTTNNGSQSSSSSTGIGVSYTYSYVYNAQTGAFEYVDYRGQSSTNSENLSAVFTNFTNSDKVAYFNASTSVNGYSYVASVPEADSYALLLAGLGLIGLVTRRKAK